MRGKVAHLEWLFEAKVEENSHTPDTPINWEPRLFISSLLKAELKAKRVLDQKNEFLAELAHLIARECGLEDWVFPCVPYRAQQCEAS